MQRKPDDRVSRVLFAASLTLVLALAGCANLPGAPSPDSEAPPAPAPALVDAEPQAEIDCRDPLMPGGEALMPEDGPTGSALPREGRVPAGFEPVAVLLCQQDVVEDEVGGGWVELTALRFVGELTPLLDALDRPDLEPGPDQVCTADLQIVPPLWLEGADGTFVRVHQPRDACGKTLRDPGFATQRLELTGSTVVARVPLPADAPIELVPPIELGG